MKLIKIGVLVNTHGLKGEVKVKCLSDFPELRFQKGKIVSLQYEGNIIPLKISHVRDNKGFLLLTFEGYQDINLVEKWKGSSLFIEASKLHTLDEDEAYYFELLDCEVFDLEERYIGKVIEVIETGANEVLRVSDKDKEMLIPFVNAFVKQVDKKEKKIIIEMMDGLSWK